MEHIYFLEDSEILSLNGKNQKEPRKKKRIELGVELSDTPLIDVLISFFSTKMV